MPRIARFSSTVHDIGMTKMAMLLCGGVVIAGGCGRSGEESELMCDASKECKMFGFCAYAGTDLPDGEPWCIPEAKPDATGPDVRPPPPTPSDEKLAAWSLPPEAVNKYQALCEASDVCKRFGRCAFDAICKPEAWDPAHCRAVDDRACAASDNCLIEGDCSINARGYCGPKSEADCRHALMCRTVGPCFFVAGDTPRCQLKRLQR